MLGNILLTRSFGRRVTMSTGMTRAYRRKVIDAIHLESVEKEIHLEILSKAFALGYQIREIPALLTWKKGRRSRFPAKRIFTTHLLFSFSEWPFLLLGTTGSVLMGAGLILGVIDLIHQVHALSTGMDPALYKPLINPILIALLVVVGIQVLLFNFIAYQNKKTQDHLTRLESDVHGIKSSKR
jgi:hypothetical protein